MDLTLPLVGILGVIGYNLNKPSNSREYIDKRVKLPLSELSNGKSIYESRKFARIQQAEREIHEKIRKNNDLVSFNNASDAKASSALSNPKKVKFTEPNVNDYKTPSPISAANKIFDGPMFSAEKYFIPESFTKDFDPKETFGNVSSLTGTTTDFAHKNMVPFFGGKVKNGNSNNTLGRYTGRDNNISKVEVPAIQNGPVNNVHGNILFTDTIQQDRFIASNNHATLLPFEQVRVQPIPGHDNRGSHKTIEELRTVNPRLPYEGRLTPGNTIAKRAIIGEVPDVRVTTDYTLGPSKHFRTKGLDEGTYYDNTDHHRDTKKNITAESQFNQNSGVNYGRGNILRASKTDDGSNTIVQEDKRGNFPGNWVRSRKAVAEVDNIPTAGNYRLREQERETGNRAGSGNVISKMRGNVNRYDEALKTTNKELTLYSYKGSMNGSSIKKEYNREAWYANETKTKGSREHTPSGKKMGAPGVGIDDYHFDTKERLIPEGHIGGRAVYVQEPTRDIGEVSKSKLIGVEKDYSHRLEQRFQPRSHDIVYGSLTNNN